MYDHVVEIFPFVASFQITDGCLSRGKLPDDVLARLPARRLSPLELLGNSLQTWR